MSDRRVPADPEWTLSLRVAGIGSVHYGSEEECCARAARAKPEQIVDGPRACGEERRPAMERRGYVGRFAA